MRSTELQWTISTSKPAESRGFDFAVAVTKNCGQQVVKGRNDVRSDEGMTAPAEPELTRITGRSQLCVSLFLKQKGQRQDQNDDAQPDRTGVHLFIKEPGTIREGSAYSVAPALGSSELSWRRQA